MTNPTFSSAARLTSALVLTLALARDAAAQFTSAIDVGTRSARPTTGAWESALALSPFARFDHPRVTIDGHWTALTGSERSGSGFGALTATWFSPTVGGLQLSLEGFADRQLLGETFRVGRLGTDARLSYRTGAAGAWIGRELSRDDKPTPVSPVARVSGGAWRQWGSALLSLRVSSFGGVEGRRASVLGTELRPAGRIPGVDTLVGPPFDTVRVVTDSGSNGRRHDWNDAELALQWGVGRLAFRGVVGTRFAASAQPNEAWGQVEGSLALRPDLALIASGGVHPSSAAYGVPRARYLELGFRVSPASLFRPRPSRGVRPVAAAFTVVDAPQGQRTLTIRVPSARTVELSGDFTGWKPVTLRPADDDRWEITLPIAPGLHRAVIRVDGDAWMPPPGVTSVPDEFQGTVGVIVVR